jgi:hypothetical protein
MDNLIICDRCGSDACYKQSMTEDINLFFCYGCGFQSNSAMIEGSDFYNEQLEVLPELYKDLITVDNDNKIWIPSAINIPDKGMVFVNGTTPENWKWSAVKAVAITEEEKEKYPILSKPGEYYEWRMDMSTMKSFEEKDFMDALSYIELLPE